MTDSRLKSLTENLTNIIIGFPINYIANIIVLPVYFNAMTDIFLDSFYIGVIFTVISVVRSYALRRLFEKFGEKENFYTLTIRLGKYLNSRIKRNV